MAAPPDVPLPILHYLGAIKTLQNPPFAPTCLLMQNPPYLLSESWSLELQ